MKNKEALQLKDEISKLNEIQFPDEMMRDCFIGMSMHILSQYFMSTSQKQRIFDGTLVYLHQMGYTPEQLKKIKAGMDELMKRFHKRNDFMG